MTPQPVQPKPSSPRYPARGTPTPRAHSTEPIHPQPTTFLVYPSEPPTIAHTLDTALSNLRTRSPQRILQSWTETPIAGRFVGTTILQQIASASLLVADISILNFNVTYEIGYAIGLQKPILLLRNKAIATSTPIFARLGIFDTLGYQSYENSRSAADILVSSSDDRQPLLLSASLKTSTPVYLTDAKLKTDAATRIISRVKKARLRFRSFDPNEQVRLSGLDAIRQVSESHAVLAHFLPTHIADAEAHNLRSAFVAGLAHGMQKVTLLLQEGNEPVPIDYRDFVVSFKYPHDIDSAIADFATRATAALQDKIQPIFSRDDNPLEKIHLGSSSAENEICHKILEQDRLPHTRDPRLFDPYRRLSDTYETDEYVTEGDFSERLSGLLSHIASEYKARFGDSVRPTLSHSALTELMYVHDVKHLRDLVVSYLEHKNALWLLFDNIDKGWPSHGIENLLK